MRVIKGKSRKSKIVEVFAAHEYGIVLDCVGIHGWSEDLEVFVIDKNDVLDIVHELKTVLDFLEQRGDKSVFVYGNFTEQQALRVEKLSIGYEDRGMKIAITVQDDSSENQIVLTDF